MPDKSLNAAVNQEKLSGLIKHSFMGKPDNYFLKIVNRVGPEQLFDFILKIIPKIPFICP